MGCCPCCCQKIYGECCGESGDRSCCITPKTCCHGKACCEESESCCGTTQYPFCCAAGTVCCGELCCDPGECCVDGACVACDCDPPCPDGKYCCNGNCQDTPCGCPCSKRGEGHVFSYVDINGNEACCPPGTTVAEYGLCDCSEGDPRCQPGTPWFMPAEPAESWIDCGGELCVLASEGCPP